jgi:hypothetical protein
MRATAYAAGNARRRVTTSAPLVIPAEINPARNRWTLVCAWMNFEKFSAVGRASGVNIIWVLFLNAETTTKYTGRIINIA